MPLTDLPNELLIMILKAMYPTGKVSQRLIPVYLELTCSPEYPFPPWPLVVATELDIKACALTCHKLHEITLVISGDR